MASRGERPASRSLDSVVVGGVTSQEDAPRPGWLGPALWGALLRHAIPVAGVLLLGWLPLDFLLFVLLETWLFLTLRAGVEGALNRSFGPVPETLVGKLGQIAVLIVMSGLFLAVVLGLVAIVVRSFAFGEAEWQEFVRGAVWLTPAFRIGLLLMAVDQVVEVARFAVRIAPLPAPDEADDRHLQRMALRVVFLALAGVAAGLAPAGAAGKSVVIAVAAAMVLFEAWPEDRTPAPAKGAPTGSAAAAGAPRTSRRRRQRSRRG